MIWNPNLVFFYVWLKKVISMIAFKETEETVVNSEIITCLCNFKLLRIATLNLVIYVSMAYTFKTKVAMKMWRKKSKGKNMTTLSLKSRKMTYNMKYKKQCMH